MEEPLNVDGQIIDATVDRVEPEYIISGDSATWTAYYGSYPSPWTLTYAFRGASGGCTVPATRYSFVNGDGSISNDDGTFTVTIAASQSAAMAPGEYQYIARVASGSIATTIRSGRLVVRPDLLNVTTQVDHITKMLTAVESVLEGRVTNDTMQFTIAGRSVTQIPIQELRQLRAQYARELYYLKRRKGGFGKNIHTTFDIVGY